MERVRDSAAMVSQMSPALDPVVYRYVAVMPDIAPQALGHAIATFRESEGVSAIIPAGLADELGQAGPDFRRIVLQVYSDLEGYGLTAAVAGALAEAQIACNMVAALHHDHVFVAAARAQEALTVLENLSQSASG